MTEDGNHGGATPEETGAALLVWSRSGERLLGTSYGPPPVDGAKLGNEHGEAASARGADEWGRGMVQGDREGGGDAAVGYPSSRKVAQIDLVPTVSLLLGTPIPFGSLGGVIPELFSGRYAVEGEEGEGEDGNMSGETAASTNDPRYYERLCDALLVNSLQVRLCS